MGNVKRNPVYLKTLSKLRSTPSLLPYFWQIYFWQSVDHVDLPPSPGIFDEKSGNFRLWNLYSLLSLLLSEGQGYKQKDTESLWLIFFIKSIFQIPGWARLSNESYKIECFYFWQYVLWPPPSPTFVKKSFLFNF